MKSQKVANENEEKSLATTDHPFTNSNAEALTSLKNLLNNKAFAKYRLHLEKIYDFCTGSEDREKRLHKILCEKNVKLNEEKKKVVAATTLKSESSKFAEDLKSELDQCWKALDETLEREEISVSLAPQSKRGQKQDVNSAAERLKNLKEALEFRREQLRNMSKQNQKSEVERENLLKRIAEQDRLIENKAKLEEICAEKEKEIDELKSAVEKQCIKLRNCKANNQFTHSDSASNLKQQPGKRKQNITTQLQSELLKQDTKIQELLAERETSDREFNKTREEVRLLNDELKRIRAKLSSVEEIQDSLHEGLPSFEEKYVALQHQFKGLQNRLNEKSLILEDVNKAQKLKEDNLQKVTKENENLEVVLEKKNQAICNMHLQVSKMSEQMEKYAIIIKQLEKGRDNYINEVSKLKEIIETAQKKMLDLQLTSNSKQFSHPNQKETEDNSSSIAHNCHVSVRREPSELLVECRSNSSSPRNFIEETLNEDLEIETPSCSAALPDEEKTPADHVGNGGSIDEISESILKVKALQAEDQCLRQHLKAMKNENLQLMNNLLTVNEAFPLLIEKAQLQGEMLKRNKKRRKQQESFLKFHHRNLTSDRNKGTQQKKLEYSKTTHEMNTEEATNQYDALEEIEMWKEKIKVLEEEVTVKTNEIDEKSELIKGQYEVIEELRKHITNCTADRDTKLMGKKLNEQKEVIKSLKGKIKLYENYIKYYQVEIEQLNSKLLKSGNTTSQCNRDKHKKHSPQKQIDALRKKILHSGRYKIN